MLINKSDIEFLNKLATESNYVDVSTIPENLKNEFQSYFLGKTLIEKKDSLYANPKDIRNWVIFLFKKYNS